MTRTASLWRHSPSAPVRLALLVASLLLAGIALASTAEATAASPPRVLVLMGSDPSLFTQAGVNATYASSLPADLTAYDAIFLYDASASWRSALKTFVADGGGVVLTYITAYTLCDRTGDLGCLGWFGPNAKYQTDGNVARTIVANAFGSALPAGALLQSDSPSYAGYPSIKEFDPNTTRAVATWGIHGNAYATETQTDGGRVAFLSDMYQRGSNTQARRDLHVAAIRWVSAGGATTEPPVTTASLAGTVGNAGWYVSNVTVTLSCAPASGSTCAGTEYATDGGSPAPYTGPFSISTDGAHTLAFASTSSRGPRETNKTITISVDRTPPAVLLDVSPCARPGDAGWCRDYNATFRVDASDAGPGSGVASLSCTWDGFGASCGPYPITLWQGAHSVCANATDVAGNRGQECAEVKLDSHAPTCSGSYSGVLGQNGWYTSYGNETIAGVDSVSGVVGLSYSHWVDMRTWISGVAYDGPVPVTNDSARHVFQCTTRDSAGNSQARSVPNASPLKVDATPPTVTFHNMCIASGQAWCSTASAQVWPGVRDATSGFGAITCTLDDLPAACGAGSISETSLPRVLPQTSAIWDGQAAYLFGGSEPDHDSSAIRRFDPPTGALTVMNATLPSGRAETASAWDGRHAYVFGGISYGLGWTLSDEILRYDPSTDTLTTMRARLPYGLAGASAVWSGEYAYVFGGRAPRAQGGSNLSDLIFRYDPVHDEISTMGARLPQGRDLASAVWDGRSALLFGGEMGDTYSAEILRYDPATDRVTTMLATLPSARMGSSAVWDGHAALVFGGYDGMNAAHDILRYDPVTDTIARGPVPGVRHRASAVWTGTEALVFGGFCGSCFDMGVLRYTPPTPIVLSEGQHALCAVPQDRAGNTGTQTCTAIGIDAAPPVATLGVSCAILGSDGWCLDPDASMSLQASDDASGVALIECTLDGETLPCALAPDGTTPPVAPGEGRHELCATPTDAAGNVGARSCLEVRIDATAPTLAFQVDPAPNADGWRNEAVTVTWSCADATSGVASVPAPSLLDEGIHHVEGACADRAGNAATRTVPEIRIDLTPPQASVAVSCDRPGNAGWCRDPNAAFVLTAGDALSGLASMACSLDGAPAECPALDQDQARVAARIGVHSLCITPVDAAGNEGERACATIQLDTWSPSITGWRTPRANAFGWANTSVLVEWDCRDSPSGVAVHPQPVLLDQEGADQWALTRCWDVAGNEQYVYYAPLVNIDLTPPEVSLASRSPPDANGWSRGDVTLAWSCADALSGALADVVETVASGEGPDVSATGLCSDRAGNQASNSVAGIRIDRTPPAIALASRTQPDRNGWNRGPVALAWECSDALSGVDNAPPPVTLQEEGASQVVTASCMDAAGWTSTHTVADVRIDLTPPQFDPYADVEAIADQRGGALVGFAKPTARDTTSGVEEVACDADPGAFFPLGVTEVACVATDAAGHTRTMRFRIVVAPGPLARIEVSGPSSIVAGTQGTFLLAGSDRFGNSVALTSNEIHVTAPTRAGPWVVTHEEQGILGAWDATVLPDALARIDVTGPSRVWGGYPAVFEVAGSDRYQNDVALSVAALPIVAPQQPGTFLATYAEMGIEGSAAYEAVLPPVARIAIEGPFTLDNASAVTNVGRPLPLRATAYDPNGRSIPFATFTWDATRGSVSDHGIFVSNTRGPGVVRAISAGTEGTLDVTVSDELHVDVTLEDDELTLMNGVVRGSVRVEFLDGAPVAGANVNVTLAPEDVDGTPFTRTVSGTTNATGVFRFTIFEFLAPPGSYEVEATARDGANEGSDRALVSMEPPAGRALAATKRELPDFPRARAA